MRGGDQELYVGPENRGPPKINCQEIASRKHTASEVKMAAMLHVQVVGQRKVSLGFR